MRLCCVPLFAAVLLTGARSNGAVTAQPVPADVADVAIDPQGNAYVTGTTTAAEFPTTAGAFQTGFASCTQTGGTCYHGFVVKLKPSGDVAWATFLEGTGGDSPSRIAFDANGAVYVTGTTTSPDFPATHPAPQGALAAFVTKLNADGASLVYSFLFNADGAIDLAVDTAGAAYVTGVPGSAASIVATPGAYRTQNGPGFVGKLNPQGTDWAYLTFFEYADSIAVNAAGEAYLASALFAAKLNATGTALAWWEDSPATVAGGACITVDRYGSAYVARGSGYGPRADFEKFSPDGTRLYLKSLEGEIGVGRVAVNSSGELYMLGGARNLGLPVTPGAIDATLYAGENGGYIVKLDSAGSQVLYASYMSNVRGYAVAVDAAGSCMSPVGRPTCPEA